MLQSSLLNIMSYCITAFYVKEMFMNSRLIQILSKKSKALLKLQCILSIKEISSILKIKKKSTENSGMDIGKDIRNAAFEEPILERCAISGES